MENNSGGYLLQKGDYISPGLYMQYWGAIVRKYGEDDAFKLNHLKQYKEMRVGAVLAAQWTSVTGEKWFVGMPHAEPSDIEVLRLVPTAMKSGRETLTPEIIKLQVTRCSAPDGEDIVEQIKRKNKPSLADHTLIVDVMGAGQIINMADVAERLSNVRPLHPQEIAILATIDAGNDDPTISTYIQYLLHPTTRSSQVQSSDSDWFFIEPTIINLTRGVSRNIKIKTGGRNLILP